MPSIVELNEAARELLFQFDRLDVRGPGWSGSPLRGYMYIPPDFGPTAVPAEPLAGGACCAPDGHCFNVAFAALCGDCSPGNSCYQGDGSECASVRCEGTCFCCRFGCPSVCEDPVLNLTYDECTAECPSPPNSSVWVLEGVGAEPSCLDYFPSCQSSGVGACCGCPDFPCFGLCADGIPPDVCSDAGGVYYDSCTCLEICPDDGGNCFEGCP